MSNTDADSLTERRWWLWLRVSAAVLAVVAVAFVAVVAWLFVSQHSMIYHPRPYGGSYAHALPANGLEIDYVVPFGKQTAFYIPGRSQIPTRLWAAFCGNGSLALDWTPMLSRYPLNGDGFLLIDYPGYGRNAGYASIESTRITANAALDTLAKRLNITEDQLQLCVVGHARVLIENYDNRQNLRTVFQENKNVQVAIFHGTHDEVIPVSMGRELKQEFPAVDFFAIKGADHGSVLYYAQDQIIAWMNR